MQRGHNENTRTQQAGLTFIELTVVLVIVLLIVAVAAPSLLAWVNESDLGATCRQLAGMVRYVRNEAASRQKTFYLTLDLENNAYWVELRRDPKDLTSSRFDTSWDDPEDSEFEPYEDQFVMRQQLRKRVVFDRVVHADLAEDSFGKVRIIFRPDGTTETVAIYLKNTQKIEGTLMLDGDTGRITLYDHYEELEPPLVLYEQYDLDE